MSSKTSSKISKGPVRRLPERASEEEKTLQAIKSMTRAARKNVSGKDRKFVELFAARGFQGANEAALEVGVKTKYAGEKMVVRLRELIDAERLRQKMLEQMSLEEAIGKMGVMARTAADERVMLAALRTVLQVEGALSLDKPLPSESQKGLSKQVAEIVESIRSRLEGSKGASGVRLRAALELETTKTYVYPDAPLEAPPE